MHISTLSALGDFVELTANESRLEFLLSESNNKLVEGDIVRTQSIDVATSLHIIVEKMAMEIQDLQTREIEKESLHEREIQDLQTQLVVVAQANKVMKSDMMGREELNSETGDIHYRVTGQIIPQMVK